MIKAFAEERCFPMIRLLLLALFFSTGCSIKNQQPEKDRVRIGSAQYLIEGNQSIDSFLTKMESLVKEARAANAEILMFPEWVSLDTWPLKSGKSEGEIVGWVSSEVTPLLMKAQKEWSQNYRMTIVSSSPRKVGKDTFVSALITTPDGNVYIQDKIYLTAWEENLGLKHGTKLIRVAHKNFKFVVLICYDIEFPDLSVELMKDRPELLLVPSMTESIEGFHRVSRSAHARAVEQTAYVFTSHTVGRVSDDWAHFGRSEFITPQIAGYKWKEAHGRMNQPQLLLVDFSIDELKRARAESTWQPAKSINKRRKSP
jgi:predicted amidohydrolase